jgi:hypothetical protein
MLRDILSERKKAIVAGWRDAIAATYPAETAKFLTNKRDQFGNPIGYTISTVSEEIYEGLLAEAALETFAQPLDNIIRIRAVQEMSPARAVCFVYLLKDVIRKELAGVLKDEENVTQELLAFESRIDQLALLAFDIYMSCREQLFRIRTGEIKKWSAHMSGPSAGDSDREGEIPE